jgi:hypothetical protein
VRAFLENKAVPLAFAWLCRGDFLFFFLLLAKLANEQGAGSVVAGRRRAWLVLLDFF